MEKYACPILTGTSVYHNCIKWDCVWWDEDNDQCYIITIGKALSKKHKSGNGENGEEGSEG